MVLILDPNYFQFKLINVISYITAYKQQIQLTIADLGSTPLQQAMLQPADRQLTSTRPSSTNVTGPMPGFRRESEL